MRYTVQGTLRSTLGANLVNEFRVGGTGGATLFSPEMNVGAASAELDREISGGFFLDINGDNLADRQHAARQRPNSSREASTKVIDNTLNWLKGSHSMQMGMNFTQGDVWLQNSRPTCPR